MRKSGPIGRVRPALLVVVSLALVTLTACGTSTPGPTPVPTRSAVAVHPGVTTSSGVRVIPDIEYGRAGGQTLLLDACLPASEAASPPASPPANPTPRASIVMIHGGSWTRGDKAEPAYRAVCEWLARSGYPTFAVDYRMDPQFVFPAALDDVRTAVSWLREEPQLGRFELDPERIGAFGGSAGGNLAALLGTVGAGPLTSGTRVAAVAELSGPADLTGADATPDFLPVQLAFLGCAREEECPNARAASPIFAVSSDDPPFFIANSLQEKIPVEQSRRFATALDAAGVATTFVEVPGGLHSIAMLGPSLRARILSFYASTLGANSGVGADGASGAG
jgi:acetyl esterase/lipase